MPEADILKTFGLIFF